MMNHKKQSNEKQDAEGSGGKRPYETPTLTKLGSVEQLTQGMPVLAVPDDGILSA